LTVRITETIDATRREIAAARQRGLVVGLVPTMGALHEGHLSLIRAAKKATGFVVVSIFVNPTQFGPNEDLARYPRPLSEDVRLCASEGVDVIFHPQPAVMYPTPYFTYVEVQDLQNLLCGASRPGHFRGVATVVLKLFNIVQPDIAYFGQKDGQQARIIQQMAADLNVPVAIEVCPIVREADGLAMSSRNRYLDNEQRQRAVVLSQSLAEAQQRIEAGERDTRNVVMRITERIAATPGAELDYVAVVDLATLRPIDSVRGIIMIALAVRFGATRLIDNLQMRVSE